MLILFCTLNDLHVICYRAVQLPGIGKLLSGRLRGAGVHTLHQLLALDPRRIESITQKNYPFGEQSRL